MNKANNFNLHQQYLLKYYQNLAEKIVSRKVSPVEFAKIQTQKHLELEEKADHDGLVGNFLNNNGFTKALERELKVLKRMKIPGTLLALDIDQLKRFNDKMGHPAGDKLIKTYAQIIVQHTRESDLKGRLGGDEFAVFLMGTDVYGAKIVAERVRIHISKKVASIFPQLTFRQTISIGIAQSQTENTADVLRERADQALYQAKQTRDNIVITQEGGQKTEFNLPLKRKLRFLFHPFS